ncbi:mechanosensitive ion channel family protein [Natronomonas sp. EA1]|uniref:mechanosensitive ion channel family protein n=1 Tax=Natronomonas sp. EA1 TaxID=3421655 RepID=UPI003EBAD1B4
MAVPDPAWLDALLAWLESLPSWLALAVIVGGSLLVARVIQVGGDWLIGRVTRRIPGDVDDVAFRTVHPALYLSVILAGAYLARGPIGLEGTLGQSLERTVVSIGILIWALTLIRLGRRVSKELVETVEGSVVPIFQNVWTAVILGLSGFLLFRVWNYDVTPLLASAGLIGIILGLAARDTIANLFGSIALYVDGTYKVGDYIVLDSGERGRVEDISIRSTVIRTRDDVLVTVPNSVLNSARITNESAPQRKRRIRIPVSVAYGSDTDHVEATLMKVAEAESLVLGEPTPRVRFRALGDSALEYELLCWVADPVLRGRASHKLLTAVYNACNREGIEIPFPQREVYLRGDPGVPHDNPEATSRPETERR